MRTVENILSRGRRLIGCGLLLLACVTTQAQVLYLNRQHMDLRIQFNAAAFDTNRLDIVMKHDLAGVDSIATNQQVYIVRTNTVSSVIVPSNPDYAFLGPVGAPIWTLPKSQDFNRPYLGVSSEEFPEGVLESPLTFELVSVEGPGNFFVWDVPGPGLPPIVKMVWTNGVLNPAVDQLTIPVDDHAHYNWGFSTNGLYRVTFRASGTTLAGSSNVVGREVAWAFQILPLRPWEQWVSTNWLPATANDIAGPAANPDGDVLPNVMEYALALDPNTASTNGLPEFAFVTVGNEQYGALTFTRVKTATDLIYLPAVRSALNTGDWETLTNIVSLVDSGDTETVTVRDSVPMSVAAARFYRLGVRLNYP